MSKQILPYPQGIWRTILRLPLLMHQYGLGGLIRPFPYLVLTTKGRRTGMERHTVLEYRRHGSKYYVISGWGKSPHWYQNLVVNPDVTLQLGSKEIAARAQVVENTSEALRALYMFQRTSPLYEIIMASMSSADTLDLRTLTDVSDEFTIVRFDVQAGNPALTGVRPKNQWLGPIILAGILMTLVWMVITRLSDE